MSAAPIEWPKLKRDYTGLLVRLRRTLMTNGGRVFKKGTVMRCDGAFGGLSLRTLRRVDGCRPGISRVQERDLDIVGRVKS